MGGCSGGVNLGGSRLCGGGSVTNPCKGGEAEAAVGMCGAVGGLFSGGLIGGGFWVECRWRRDGWCGRGVVWCRYVRSVFNGSRCGGSPFIHD